MPRGYGLGYRSRRTGTEYTHQTAYRLAKGIIPEGMCVLHRCDNPPCCNPNHLFLGTKRDNSVDMARKGRVRNQFGTWGISRARA